MRKGIVTLGVIAVVAMALLSVGPIVYRLVTDRGLQTASIATGGEPATVDMNGTWTIVAGAGANQTQAGYTFDEVLPGQRKSTSGRADNSNGENISGSLTVHNRSLDEARVEVTVDAISSDVERRDINVRSHILHTEQYPTARFVLTRPADLSDLPDNGTPIDVPVTGELTLKGTTKPVTVTLRVLRTGKYVIVEGKVPFNRADYGIDSPPFVASKIADSGTVDLLLVFERKA